MNLSERHCLNCEVAGRSQAGGEWIVVCKNATTNAMDGSVDCGAILADKTEASPYVALLEAKLTAMEQVVIQLYRENEPWADLYDDNEILEAGLESLAVLKQAAPIKEK